MSKQILTQSTLKQILFYSPDSGEFTRVKTQSWNAKRGSIAGCIGGNGYLRIHVNGKLHQSHRLAWLYMHGEFPENDIDHINGDRTDNRLLNLRAATRQENVRNTLMQKNNRTGYKGVKKNGSGYSARIMINGVQLHLGTYPTPELAHSVYQKEAKLHFKEFYKSPEQRPSP